jgi:hypothetical protein
MGKRGQGKDVRSDISFGNLLKTGFGLNPAFAPSYLKLLS